MENNAIIFDQIVNQRRSIRLFDTEHPYDKSIVQRSLERAILSPNSSNMQLWEFYRIISPQAKATVADFCMGQRTAVTAQELVVFVARPDKYKQSIARNLAEIDNPQNHESDRGKALRRKYYSKLMPLFYRGDFLNILSCIKRLIVSVAAFKRPVVHEVTACDKKVTIHKSVGLAAQTFMLSVKAEGYDTCPMEGFDSKRLKKFLKLPRKAQINMVISVGKGKYPEGVSYPRWRYSYDEVVREV